MSIHLVDVYLDITNSSEGYSFHILTCESQYFKNDSPLVYLAIREAHGIKGCGLGVQAYGNVCQLLGISAPGISKLVEQFRIR